MFNMCSLIWNYVFWLFLVVLNIWDDSGFTRFKRWIGRRGSLRWYKHRTSSSRFSRLLVVLYVCSSLHDLLFASLFFSPFLRSVCTDGVTKCAVKHHHRDGRKDEYRKKQKQMKRRGSFWVRAPRAPYSMPWPSSRFWGRHVLRRQSQHAVWRCRKLCNTFAIRVPPKLWFWD